MDASRFNVAAGVGRPAISLTMGALEGFLSARAWLQSIDPLLLNLDLEGAGLELNAASGSTLFDHNADGTRTGIGWIGADDGILVRDLNGNGSIPAAFSSAALPTNQGR